MGYPLKKILASLPPGPRPPIFIGVAEPLHNCTYCTEFQVMPTELQGRLAAL